MEQQPFREPPGFSQLSKAEQISYIQKLWDKVAQASGDLPVPPSHLELLRQRLESFEKAPAAVKSATDILDRLSAKK